MRILIAEDHGIVRQGLRALIENQVDMEVVGEAQDGLVAVRLAKELSLDVIITDRESKALQLILEGKNTKQIALELHVRKTRPSRRTGVKLWKSSMPTAYVAFSK